MCFSRWGMNLKLILTEVAQLAYLWILNTRFSFPLLFYLRIIILEYFNSLYLHNHSFGIINRLKVSLFECNLSFKFQIVFYFHMVVGKNANLGNGPNDMHDIGQQPRLPIWSHLQLLDTFIFLKLFVSFYYFIIL